MAALEPNKGHAALRRGRFWLNLQLARDIELACAALGPALERDIKPLVA